MRTTRERSSRRGHPGESISEERAFKIAREANGNPFFLEQLTQYRSLTTAERMERASFAGMLEARLQELPPGARAFLETLSICARPGHPTWSSMPRVSPGDGRRLEALLRAARLIRSSGSSERIEPYHDRIRETLAAQLSAEGVRRIHGRLVDALEARQIDDPEALFAHCRGAGDHPAAAEHACAAAQKADGGARVRSGSVAVSQALDLTALTPPPWAWQASLGGRPGPRRPTRRGRRGLRASGGCL